MPRRPPAVPSGDGGAPDGSDAGASPVGVRPADPRTYDFVIHRFLVDPWAGPPSNRGFYGFNLDERFSPSASSSQGRGLILLRVADVDGALGPDLDDPAVTVSVFPDARPLFADCAAITEPRRPYAVDNRHLTVAGDPRSARLYLPGSIVRGRLRVAAPAASVLPFALGLGGTSRIRALQLRVSLTEAAGARGNLGGYLEQTELVDLLTTVPPLRSYRDALAPLFQGFVDLATPAPTGARSCDHPEGGIGVGLGFEAVRATILAATSGPVPGMCGSAATTSTP